MSSSKSSFGFLTGDDLTGLGEGRGFGFLTALAPLGFGSGSLTSINVSCVRNLSPQARHTRLRLTEPSSLTLVSVTSSFPALHVGHCTGYLFVRDAPSTKHLSNGVSRAFLFGAVSDNTNRDAAIGGIRNGYRDFCHRIHLQIVGHQPLASSLARL